MAQDSSIEWTHATFNPWRGCSKVHAGCTNCYAEKNIGVKMQGITWGEVWQGGQRVVAADSAWESPLRWARAAAKAAERRRVFCASLADVLEIPDVPPPRIDATLYQQAMRRVEDARSALTRARDRLWDTVWGTAQMCLCGPLCEAGHDHGCPHLGASRWSAGLDWLLLTKRPENWRLVPEHIRPLVWLGTSISDQKTADEWVPRLLQAEGFRLRFLSVEPLVGPVDLWPFFSVADRNGELSGPRCNKDGSPAIGWVIVGGESGSKARPCSVEWVRDIVRQCREAGVPCFVKQLGSHPMGLGGYGDFAEHMDPKGGDMAEWPEDIRIREFPEAA